MQGLHNMGRDKGGTGNHPMGAGPTSNYTLPGIMQYLQTQFTQVERNRLQSELERSSLKMKIIELENEKNTLLRRTDQLQSQVDQLTLELKQFKPESGKSDANDGTADENSESISLDRIHSQDVTTLAHAKKFLKSATNEILYLLKTPTMELEDVSTVGGITGISSLLGKSDNNDLFINYSDLDVNHTNRFEKSDGDDDSFKEFSTTSNMSAAQELMSGNEVERHLNDIISGKDTAESDAETIIAENNDHSDKGIEKEASINGGIVEVNGDEDDAEDDDDDFDDDDDDDDDDDNDDDDDDEEEDGNIVNDGAHGKKEREKLYKLLQKSPKKLRSNSISALPSLDVKLDANLSEMEVKNGRLFTYYDKSNSVKVYGNLREGSKLVKEIELPDANTVVDIVTTDRHVVIATLDSIIIIDIFRPAGEDRIIKSGVQGKSIDSDNSQVLLVTDDTIEVYEIDFSQKALRQMITFNYKYEGILKKAKLVKNNETYKIALLSSTTLYMYQSNTTQDAAISHRSIPLSTYCEWLMTSKYLVLNFDHGLFLFDFCECSEFKKVPISPQLSSEPNSRPVSGAIGECADNDSVFYITKGNNSARSMKADQSYELYVFEATEHADITEVMKLTDLQPNERYCVGMLDEKLAVFIARGRKVYLRSITI